MNKIGLLLLFISGNCFGSDMYRPRYDVSRLEEPIVINRIRALAPHIREGREISLAHLISTVIEIKRLIIESEPAMDEIRIFHHVIPITGVVTVQWHPQYKVFTVARAGADNVSILSPVKLSHKSDSWTNLAKKVLHKPVAEILAAFDSK